MKQESLKYSDFDGFEIDGVKVSTLRFEYGNLCQYMVDPPTFEEWLKERGMRNEKTA